MRSGTGVNRLLLIFTLLALPFAVGSECAFFFSSGGGSGGTIVDDDDDDEEEKPGIVKTGTFTSPAAAGIGYTSASRSGVTDSSGRFQYRDGETVQFSIGDIALGAPVTARPAVSPRDLVAKDPRGATAATNMSRLLQSLDADRGDAVVTIPASVRKAAVRSNTSIATAIEYLDFADDAAFANAASQLVAVLADDYAHTATLVDAQDVADSTVSVEPASAASSQSQ